MTAWQVLAMRAALEAAQYIAEGCPSLAEDRLKEAAGNLDWWRKEQHAAPDAAGSEGEAVLSDHPNWNPRYIAYAKAHGRTPEEMKAFDEHRFRNAGGMGFVLWMHDRQAEARLQAPHLFHRSGGIADQDGYTDWLMKRAEALAAALSEDAA